MSDLVRQLREVGGLDPAAELCSYAADRIEQLEAALREIANSPAWGAPDKWETTPFEVRQLARAVLEGKDG